MERTVRGSVQVELEFPEIPTGEVRTQDFELAAAEPGDEVVIHHPPFGIAGLKLTAYVPQDGAVRVRCRNATDEMALKLPLGSYGLEVRRF